MSVLIVMHIYIYMYRERERDIIDKEREREITPCAKAIVLITATSGPTVSIIIVTQNNIIIYIQL